MSNPEHDEQLKELRQQLEQAELSKPSKASRSGSAVFTIIIVLFALIGLFIALGSVFSGKKQQSQTQSTNPVQVAQENQETNQDQEYLQAENDFVGSANAALDEGWVQVNQLFCASSMAIIREAQNDAQTKGIPVKVALRTRLNWVRREMQTVDAYKSVITGDNTRQLQHPERVAAMIQHYSQLIASKTGNKLKPEEINAIAQVIAQDVGYESNRDAARRITGDAMGVLGAISMIYARDDRNPANINANCAVNLARLAALLGNVDEDAIALESLDSSAINHWDNINTGRVIKPEPVPNRNSELSPLPIPISTNNEDAN